MSARQRNLRRGNMSTPKRSTTLLAVTGALILGSLALGGGVASASPPSTSAQSFGLIGDSRHVLDPITVVFECHAAHLAQVPLASSTTVSCYLEFDYGGKRCYAATATRSGGYAATGSTCTNSLYSQWKVCVNGSVLHGNGITESSGWNCYPPTVRP
jgi:hypothetical protein